VQLDNDALYAFSTWRAFGQPDWFAAQYGFQFYDLGGGQFQLGDTGQRFNESGFLIEDSPPDEAPADPPPEILNPPMFEIEDSGYDDWGPSFDSDQLTWGDPGGSAFDVVDNWADDWGPSFDSDQVTWGDPGQFEVVESEDGWGDSFDSSQLSWGDPGLFEVVDDSAGGWGPSYDSSQLSWGDPGLFEVVESSGEGWGPSFTSDQLTWGDPSESIFAIEPTYNDYTPPPGLASVPSTSAPRGTTSTGGGGMAGGGSSRAGGSSGGGGPSGSGSSNSATDPLRNLVAGLGNLLGTVLGAKAVQSLSGGGAVAVKSSTGSVQPLTTTPKSAVTPFSLPASNLTLLAAAVVAGFLILRPSK
jgi:hypothetical protein